MNKDSPLAKLLAEDIEDDTMPKQIRIQKGGKPRPKPIIPKEGQILKKGK